MFSRSTFFESLEALETGKSLSLCKASVYKSFWFYGIFTTTTIETT
jgi:hypothetical protein